MVTKASGKKADGKITVKQYRSAAGADKRTKASLAALGLGRIGKQKVLPSNPALLGQVARVAHLVTIIDS